ncbi:MAG TPA: sigma-70 family RNA polymerase sigma factor [Phototrophicaceae bacterium]|nr:sigma-70 family RNA polymerase sigma factor [Phototrophicaceae bacterium]
MTDELELLREVRAFDLEALSVVFDRYYDPIYRFIYHHVHHIQAAEDLAAKVFQRLLTQIAAGNGPEQHLKAWLFRVAYHLIVDDARRQQHRNHDELTEDTAISASVETDAAAALLVAQAYTALERLTAGQRDVIILRYLMAMTPGETAAILNLSVGAVKALQHRGLTALRQEMQVAKEGDYE